MQSFDYSMEGNTLAEIDATGAASACPHCDAPVSLGPQPRPSEIVECTQCRTELEVLSIDPLLLGVAPEIEEDWGE